MVDSVTATVNKLEGVGLYISTVSDDSALYQKVSEGDIITHVNGVEITNDDIVLDIIEECKAGDKITVTVLKKNGSTAEFSAELKANIGESSYSEKIDESQESNESSGGGTFNFPQGE